jgi:hypothetical protein
MDDPVFECAHGEKDFFFVQITQTDSVAHPAFYSMRTGVIPGGGSLVRA